MSNNNRSLKEVWRYMLNARIPRIFYGVDMQWPRKVLEGTLSKPAEHASYQDNQIRLLHSTSKTRVVLTLFDVFHWSGIRFNVIHPATLSLPYTHVSSFPTGSRVPVLPYAIRDDVDDVLGKLCWNSSYVFQRRTVSSDSNFLKTFI
ncbi:hypothetical protein TNCV_5012661 [Trichonephila clavipes]|nr:hypothetical protein TNCV_5012661 [Trichonephila clavipes]